MEEELENIGHDKKFESGYGCEFCGSTVVVCYEGWKQEREKRLKEIATLREALGQKNGLIKMALDELGVPSPEYPAPVSNAVDFLREALGDGGE